MVLTEKQRGELHKAILDYLRSNGYEKTYQQFRDEAKVPEAGPPTENVLEKKWVSIIRLQKKIDDLEAKIEQMKEESGTVGKMRLLGKDTSSDHLPQAPEKMVLQGHRGQVTKVLFHPVYSLLVSASEDATIKVWDLETGKPERSLKDHTGVVNDLAFNLPGTILASCSSDLTIKLWDFQAFECTKTLHGHEHNVTGIAFLPSGDHLVSASRDKTVKLWEVVSGFCIRTFEGHKEWVRKVLVHPTLPLMVTCSQDQTAIVWDISEAVSKASSASNCIMQVLDGHENVVEAIAIANDNAALVIEKSEYYSKLMYAASVEMMTAGGGANGNAPALGEEEKKAAAKGKKKSDKVFVATGGRDKLIKIWDAKVGREVAKLVGHDNWVRDLVFHPSGKYLLSAADDKSIRVWDLNTGRCIKKIADAHTHFVSCLDFSDKYLVCASGSVDNTIKIWDCN
ncbi:MAG: WD40 repeat domain-containing protein [Acidobacteriaceae bacterium]|nr:WD40 repeat domain-containing protein [Acidobacteriaceae bacterium]